MAPIMATKQTKTQFHFSRRISLSVSVRSVYIIIILFCSQIHEHNYNNIIILLSNNNYILCWSHDLQLIRCV